jgi:hypothetical protein
MFFPVRDNHQGRGNKKVGKKGCGNGNACQESEIAKPSFQPVSEFLLTGKWQILAFSMKEYSGVRMACQFRGVFRQHANIALSFGQLVPA